MGDRTETQDRAHSGKHSLLATMAHELRGPLNVCVMWLDLLSLKAAQPDEVRKAVEVMRRNLSHQATLLRELDDIAQMFASGIALNRRTLDMGELIGAAIEPWRSAADERNVRFDYEMAGPHRQVDGDAERLLQVLNYGFENALAATLPGGAIIARVDGLDEQLEVAIEDTGLGLDAEQSARFFDAPMEGPRRQKSLGLRLAIAKHLVERHGGRIAMRSEGPEHGCTLTVRLPIKR